MGVVFCFAFVACEVKTNLSSFLFLSASSFLLPPAVVVVVANLSSPFSLAADDDDDDDVDVPLAATVLLLLALPPLDSLLVVVAVPLLFLFSFLSVLSGRESEQADTNILGGIFFYIFFV